MKPAARNLGAAVGLVAVAFTAGAAMIGASAAERKEAGLKETFVSVPMPPGIRVESTELHGPVFADEAGHTLYVWPTVDKRNGVAGEDKGKPICDNTRITATAGLMSIYPAGLELPDVDTRPTCVQVWPPLMAADDAKAVGAWSIVTRKDGGKQWAYQGQAVYRSALDQQPGDVLGAVMHKRGRDDSAPRVPIGPPADLPPGFGVETTYLGRFMYGPHSMAVYTSDRDGKDKSNCVGSCTEEWDPVLVPSFFKPHGEWSVTERSPGIRQITYRGKPLYTHPNDREIRSQEGSDIPGWHNVYTQLAPRLPPVLKLQDTSLGQVIADTKGRTIYAYNCDEDTVDQLSCDNPTTTQVYRFAICGLGDPDRCMKRWPLVVASATDKSDSRTWSVITFDPKTGRIAQPGQAGALRVWAYRGRPIYTYSGDSAPGDLWGNDIGEIYGRHNGFTAFIVRKDF